MLRIFTNLNKYGTLRNRIIHVPDGKPFTHGPNYGPIVGSRVFKYEYTGSISPALTQLNGKKYIIPSWQEVLPETTLNDIEWVKDALNDFDESKITYITAGSQLIL